MQLRTTPAEKEFKEKMNRKIKKGEEKEIRIRNCIGVPSAAWLNLNTVFLTMV
jgi:hypothetical protein